MRKVLVTFALAAGLACGRAPVGPDTSPDPAAGFDVGSTCFELRLGGTPAPDVKLPRLIELIREPAPGFVEPGRFAVREPIGVPQAPFSWWMPKGDSTLDLVLGGGYTGYAFSLERKGRGWAGEGTYFADFGVEPSPLPLALYLSPRACS